jgi:peroxiredoxin Q/BCP
LPYPLLADVDKAVCIKYGVLKEKSMYGRKYMGIDRSTFVISPEGKIAAIISGLKPDEHAGAVIKALQPA